MKDIKYTILYCVTFCDSFYYGSGTVISSGSAKVRT